ncbi:S-layer homology domain-containing protein [Niallia oryzisoli]|uniref:S-layer homology domain-containing protein n=1 Tax=Niallia oryzisoli TaxID=1737571 RepID=A0ABZ2CN85_9BACI
MKKYVSLFFGVLLTLVLFVPSASAASFKDVPANHLFFDEIDYLSNSNVITGYKDGRFGPEDKVTRAAAATMIGRALGLDGKQRATIFTDVNSANFASGYITSAVEWGIINGFPDGTFRPNATLTRGQMAILIDRAFKLSETSDIRFYDVSSTSSAYQSIYKIVEAGITNGYTDGTFKPNLDMTRAQFSAFLARALDDRFKVSPPVIPDPVNWDGEWKREDFANPGLLTITNSNSSSLHFSLNVTSGANVGWIEGNAQIQGTTAQYNDTDSSCKLIFTHNGESIQVEQTMDCYQYGGMGTYFDGDFTGNPADTQPSLYPRVLESQSLDEEFRQMTGADYQDFVNSMQLINGEELYDSEVNGKVITGAVRGLYTIMEGIVIIGDDGNLYGAVIKDGDTVHYYTTNPAYKNKLPESIADWKADFDSYPVKYFYSGVEQTPQGVTPEQAEQIIRQALQVPHSASVVYDYDDGDYYVIHVYDVVKDDVSSHNVTRGWYAVNKNTGEWFDYMNSF